MEDKRTVVIPCDVAITRYYRMYVEMPEGASADEVKAKAIETLTDGRDADAELTPDPDLDIEAEDITWVNPDFEGSWTKDEEEEVARLIEQTHSKDGDHE